MKELDMDLKKPNTTKFTKHLNQTLTNEVTNELQVSHFQET